MIKISELSMMLLEIRTARPENVDHRIMDVIYKYREATDRIAELKERIEELEGMLSRLEWDSGDCGGQCPICREYENDGHGFDWVDSEPRPPNPRFIYVWDDLSEYVQIDEVTPVDEEDYTQNDEET